ncbi:MAG: 2'-5' RNA ligase family protein [Actinomycetota bacterium]
MQFTKQWIFRVYERDVLAVLDALDTAGVDAWLTGGWGVDALLGGQTRRHGDLDLLLRSEDDIPAAVEALAGIGIDTVDTSTVGGHWMPVMVQVRDRTRRVVDLLPVDPATLPADEPFAVGTLDGRPVPCLAPDVQVAFHLGYRPRSVHRRDVRKICERYGLKPPALAPGPGASLVRRARRLARRVRGRLGRRSLALESALVVPVPAADAVVERERAALGLRPESGAAAHVTLLYPFAPVDTIDAETERTIGALVARFALFRFRLTELGRFPGNLHLVPEPTAVFVRMTEALAAHWPEYPPYGGAFATIVPHVTVAEDDALGLADALALALPLETVAEHVDLMVQDGDRQWSVRRRFRLGGEPPGGR